jgi:hypothetical protein
VALEDAVASSSIRLRGDPLLVGYQRSRFSVLRGPFSRFASHAGRDAAILEERSRVYDTARQRHPERWSGEIRDWTPVRLVHLNPEPGELAVA